MDANTNITDGMGVEMLEDLCAGLTPRESGLVALGQSIGALKQIRALVDAGTTFDGLFEASGFTLRELAVMTGSNVSTLGRYKNVHRKDHLEPPRWLLVFLSSWVLLTPGQRRKVAASFGHRLSAQAEGTPPAVVTAASANGNGHAPAVAAA